MSILLNRFFPAVLFFLLLSGLNTLPTVQKIYYPAFEKLTLAAASYGQSDIYFKSRLNRQGNPANSSEVIVLFNSKAYLQQLIQQEKRSGKRSAYDYKGFSVHVSETFVTSLIFFLALLLIVSADIQKKLLYFITGAFLTLGFANLTVVFKRWSLVADSGVTGIDYYPKELEFYRLLSYLFSNVTTITFVLVLWLLTLIFFLGKKSSQPQYSPPM